MIDYPTSLDDFTNPTNSTLLENIHPNLHSNINDAVEALEAKVGIDSSAVDTSLDYLVKNASSSNPGHKHTLANGATDVTASAAELNIMDGVTADKDELNQLDGVTVGGTSAGDIVTIDDTQTLTNKTLSTGVALDANADPNITYYGMARQAIINGNFDVWQRGTTFTALGNTTYGADRWRVGGIWDGVADMKRSTDVPTMAESGVESNYSLQIDVTTADATIAAGHYYFFSQTIEGYNTQAFGFGLSGTRYMTLSFWVKATKTGTYCCALRNRTTYNRSYVAEYTVSTTDTWEYKAITFPIDSTGTWGKAENAGVEIVWTLASGSTFQTTVDTWADGNYLATSNQVNGMDSADNNFRISQVLLNAGSVALPFQPKSFEEELRACMRYFQKSYQYSTAPGSATSFGYDATPVFIAVHADYAVGGTPFFVPMRVGNHTVTIYAGDGTANACTNFLSGVKITSVSPASYYGMGGLRAITKVGAFSVGSGYTFDWTASAEL